MWSFFKSLKIIVFTFEHKTFMLLFYTKIEVHLVVQCGYFYNISAIRSLYCWHLTFKTKSILGKVWKKKVIQSRIQQRSSIIYLSSFFCHVLLKMLFVVHNCSVPFCNCLLLAYPNVINNLLIIFILLANICT